jgi:TATA-binding protein-associated factor Taf7
MALEAAAGRSISLEIVTRLKPSEVDGAEEEEEEEDEDEDDEEEEEEDDDDESRSETALGLTLDDIVKLSSCYEALVILCSFPFALCQND